MIYKVFSKLDKDCLIYLIENKVINISELNRIKNIDTKSYVIQHGNYIQITDLLLVDGTIEYPRTLAKNHLCEHEYCNIFGSIVDGKTALSKFSEDEYVLVLIDGSYIKLTKDVLQLSDFFTNKFKFKVVI